MVGEVPEHWEVTKGKAVSLKNRDKNYRPSIQDESGDYDVVRIKSFKHGEVARSVKMQNYTV